MTGAFRALRDRLELAHITFHSLRHFTATTLAAGGVGIRTIAGRLGHANPGITLRTYAHFLDAADREAAVAIGDALAGIQPASAKRPSASSRPDGGPPAGDRTGLTEFPPRHQVVSKIPRDTQKGADFLDTQGQPLRDGKALLLFLRMTFLSRQAVVRVHAASSRKCLKVLRFSARSWAMVRA